MDNGKIPLVKARELDWYSREHGVSGDKLYAEILFARDVDAMRTLYMLEYGEPANNEDLHYVLFDNDRLKSLHDDLMNRLGDTNRDTFGFFDARKYRSAMAMSVVNTLGDIEGAGMLVDGLDSLRYSLDINDVDVFKGFITPWMDEDQLRAVGGGDRALDDARKLMAFNQSVSPLLKADVQYGQFTFPVNPMKASSVTLPATELLESTTYDVAQYDVELLPVSRRGDSDMADLIVKAGYMDDEDAASDFVHNIDNMEQGFRQTYSAFPQPNYDTLSTIADSVGVLTDIDAVSDHLDYHGLKVAVSAYNDIMFARDMECLNAALMYEGWQDCGGHPNVNVDTMLTENEIQRIRERVDPHSCMVFGAAYWERFDSHDETCKIEPHVIVDKDKYEQGLTQGIEQVLSDRKMDKGLATVIIDETRAMRFSPNVVDHRQCMEYFMGPSRNDDCQMVGQGTAAKIAAYKPYVQLTGVSIDDLRLYLTTKPSLIERDRKEMHTRMGNCLADFLTPIDVYQDEAISDGVPAEALRNHDAAVIYQNCQDAWTQTEAAFDLQRQANQQRALTQDVLQSKIDAAKNLADRMCSDTQFDGDLSMG